MQSDTVAGLLQIQLVTPRACCCTSECNFAVIATGTEIALSCAEYCTNLDHSLLKQQPYTANQEAQAIQSPCYPDSCTWIHSVTGKLREEHAAAPVKMITWLTDLSLWKDDLCARCIVGVGDGVTQQAHGAHHLAGPAHPVWEVGGVPHHLTPQGNQVSHTAVVR